MKKLILFLLAASLLCTSCLAGEIDLSATPAPAPIEQTRIPELSTVPLLDAPPMPLNCAAALLVEPDSGQILFEMNADVARPVASVTKVMTILLTLEAIQQGRIQLNQALTISESAAGMGGSQVLLDVGETQTVDVLLKSMIVGSANDASVALAELMYGSEDLCAAQMNQRAQELGMTDSHFVNCTGLPAEGQHTTARDVARMTMAMLRHDLYYNYSTIWLDEVDHGDGRVTQLTNTNKLTRLCDGCDGGKTGSTNEAGFCIAATAKRGDMRLIAVVLGADSGKERFAIAEEMLDFGFANYRLYPVAQKGTKVRGTLSVEGGRPDGVELQLDGDLTLLVNKGSEGEVRLVPELPESVTAPVELGDLIGHVRVEQDGKIIARLPITAASESQVKGIGSSVKKILGKWVYCA